MNNEIKAVIQLVEDQLGVSLGVEKANFRETRDIILVKITGQSRYALKFARTSEINENNQARIQSVFDEITILETSEVFKDYFMCGGSNEKFVWLLVKWIDGKSLHKYLNEKSKESDYKVLVIKTYLKIIFAVEFLHKNNIFHRDIQPDHFIVDKEGKINVLDFGVSSFIDSPMKYKGALVHFLAPELASQLAEGAPFVGYQLPQEIFSLGSMFYFNFYGKVSTSYEVKESSYMDKLRQIAKDGASAIQTETNDSFPELLEFLKKCTNIKVDKRFASLSEMKDRLNLILSEIS